MTLPREGAERGAVEGHMSIMSGESLAATFLSGRNSSSNNLPHETHLSRLDWTVSQDGEASENPVPAHRKEGPCFLQSPGGVGSQEMLDQRGVTHQEKNVLILASNLKKKKKKLNSAFSALLRLSQTTVPMVDDKEGGS